MNAAVFAQFRTNPESFIFPDSGSNIERKFAQEPDTSSEVVVYAKLPRSFHIPTPVGDYNSNRKSARKGQFCSY